MRCGMDVVALFKLSSRFALKLDAREKGPGGVSAATPRY
jgi:hypothetical protein